MKLSDYFDKIFIIGALNSTKVNNTIELLKKLDLYDENVLVHMYTPINEIKLKCKELPDYGYDDALSIILAQYTIVKQAYDAGLKSVLILEDDNSLLKDLTKWSEILDNLPEDWNVIRFSGFTMYNEDKSNYMNFDKGNFIKHEYSRQFYLIWGASALALDRTGMEAYIHSQETMLRQVDHVNDVFICSREEDYYNMYEDCGNKPLNIYFANYSLFCPLNDIYKNIDALNYTRIDINDYLISDEDIHFINSKDANIFNNKKLRSCVICVSKNAVDINDWYNYYLDLGFDHIFLFDNNNYQNNYKIDDNRVTIIKYPSVYKCQMDNKTGEWRQCFLIKIGIMMAFDQGFDYCFICDDDEYLDLKGNYKSVNDFLVKYNYYDSICVSWEIMSDNDYIYIDDEPKGKKLREIYVNNNGEFYQRKSFYKLPKKWEVLQDDMKIMHTIMHQVTERRSIDIDIEVATVKHYITFCMERFLLHKGKYDGDGSNEYLDNKLLGYYSLYNNLTKEKILGYIDLCRKYNMPISEDDKNIIRENGIDYETI